MRLTPATGTAESHPHEATHTNGHPHEQQEKAETPAGEVAEPARNATAQNGSQVFGLTTHGAGGTPLKVTFQNCGGIVRKNLSGIVILLGVVVLLCMVFMPFVTGRNHSQPQVGGTQAIFPWSSPGYH